jgi:hypothetical protein
MVVTFKDPDAPRSLHAFFGRSDPYNLYRCTLLKVSTYNLCTSFLETNSTIYIYLCVYHILQNFYSRNT